MKEHTVKPIGIVYSGLNTREDVLDSDVKSNIGTIEIFDECALGLQDIEGFSHIVIVSWLHDSDFHSLHVRPLYHPETPRGLFSTLTPDRPNPIGITIVELLERKENILQVKGLDLIENTPVLDIKPYTYSYQREPTSLGWLDEKGPNAIP